jgi:hypothetical protein
MVTLQDALNATKDEIGNYSTGVIVDDVVIRAIMRATDYVKRQMGIPSDEFRQTILFTDDQKYYDLNADNMECLLLLYTDENLNTEQTRWEYENYTDILHRTGGDRTNRWSVTYINGKKQLIVHGYNQNGGQILDEMDNVGDWVVADDASGLALDTNQKYSGVGSLSFDITNATGVATITNPNVSYDLEALFEQHGYLKLRAYMTDNNIDSITLKLYTDASNYYTIAVDIADDGTEFAQDSFQKIGFACDDAILTGSPDPSDINQIDVEFDLGAGFTTAADFRIDTLFTVVPDSLDLIYYTKYKGTDTTLATYKTTLNVVTDKFLFTSTDEDILEVIAQKAAIILWPQVRGDKEQLMIQKNELRDNMKSFTKRWPRRRVQGTFKTYLRR